MSDIAPDMRPAEQLVNAEAFAEATLSAARESRGRPQLPDHQQIAVCIAAAAVVVALGYASSASHAYIPFLWGVDLAIHEFGHLVTFWAPWRVTAAAGSVFQVAVPLGVAAYLLFGRRQLWLAGVLTAWAGCSARNVAVYIADAPYQRLALWGGDGVLHDWAQLLAGRQMQYAGTIASALDALGWLLVVVGLVLALWPLAMRARSAWLAARRDAASASRRAELPVREPHGPIG
jgi:hypothetical protein